MLTPYDRFNPFREMRRMLDAMEAAMTRSLAPSDGLLTPVDASPLALDITTDENNVVVRTAVPGVREEDINVEVNGDMLTITAESKSEREDSRRNWYMREMRYGRFARSVRLPEGVNADKAEATLENGILTIKLPKSRPNPVKQIAVKAKKLLQGKN